MRTKSGRLQFYQHIAARLDCDELKLDFLDKRCR